MSIFKHLKTTIPEYGKIRTMKFMKNKKAFTLIELLIVIAIIGILSSAILVNVTSARQRANDAKRKSDLNQIGAAYMSYFASTGSYWVPNTGWLNGGEGWFNYQEVSSYPTSMADGLIGLGYFSVAPLDPGLTHASQGTASAGPGARQYMKYSCAAGFAVYAQLELPSAQDQADYNKIISNHGCPDLTAAYRMNYGMYFY